MFMTQLYQKVILSLILTSCIFFAFGQVSSDEMMISAQEAFDQRNFGHAINILFYTREICNDDGKLKEVSLLLERAFIEIEKQEQAADSARQIAVTERDRADSLLDVATIARNSAENARLKAEENEQRAIKQEKETRRLLLLELSRSLANKALNEKDIELKGLLALHAYKFNMENGGDTFDSKIFESLTNAFRSLERGYPDRNKIDDTEIRSLFRVGKNVISTNASDESFRWLLSDDNRLELAYDLKKDIKNGLISISPDNQWLLREISNRSKGQHVRRLELCGLQNDTIHELELKEYNSEPNAIVFLSENLIVYGGNDSTIRQYNIATEESSILMAPNYIARSLTVNLDHQIIATAGDNRQIDIWDLSTKRLSTSIPGHTARICDLTFSQDGLHLVSASRDRTIRVWHAGILSKESSTIDEMWSGQSSMIIEGHNSWVLSAIFSSDNSSVIAGDKNGNIIRWLVSPQKIAENICSKINRTLTKLEWNELLGEELVKEIPFEPYCPN